MKKGIFALAFATSLITTQNCMAMDYLGAMYNPDKGTLFGTTDITLTTASYDLKNDTTNNSDSYDVSQTHINQEVEVGFGNSIVGLARIGYTISSTTEQGSSEESESGLERIDIGARYRLSDKIKLPMTMDVGVSFKPSFQDREEANNNDDGTANSGGHELGIFARAGSNKLYFKVSFDYLMEQTANDATTGDASYTIDPSMNLAAQVGTQFSPMEKLLIDASGLLQRSGEQVINYESGGDATYESVISYGLDVQAYYEFLAGLSAKAGFTYVNSQNQNIDGNQDYIVENRSSMSLNIGASYRF